MDRPPTSNRPSLRGRPRDEHARSEGGGGRAPRRPQGLRHRPRGRQGLLGVDALKDAALHGTEPDLGAHRVYVAEGHRQPVGVIALTADVVPYQWALSDVEELAFAIATGIAYLRDLDEAGVGAEVAASQIEFRVAATADQFGDHCCRALRRCGRGSRRSAAPEPLRGATIHAVTSPRMMSKVDPHVNMLRTTIATFGVAAGGADAITVLLLDQRTDCRPCSAGRIARNTQVIAAEESHLPRGRPGRRLVVRRIAFTDDLAWAAWTIVQEIEGAGGMAAALASGSIAARIDATNADCRKLATRAIELTGVSMFPLAGEGVTKEAAPGGLEPGRLKQIRDAEVFEELREAAWKHAEARRARRPRCSWHAWASSATSGWPNFALILEARLPRIIDGLRQHWGFALP